MDFHRNPWISIDHYGSWTKKRLLIMAEVIELCSVINFNTQCIRGIYDKKVLDLFVYDVTTITIKIFNLLYLIILNFIIN